MLATDFFDYPLGMEDTIITLGVFEKIQYELKDIIHLDCCTRVTELTMID